MATAVTTRPPQTIPARRESRRPGVARPTLPNVTGFMDRQIPDIPAPLVINSDYILKKYAGRTPSLVVHLHPTFFRFDNQDGSFPYNSPMSFFIKHLKKSTVPHEMMEEFIAHGVKFYDGCLIVEVHDHKTGATEKQPTSSSVVNGNGAKPFSVHNYNSFITPSPYGKFSDKIDQVTSKESDPKTVPEGNKDVDADKENMPAPSQKKKRARVVTTVLFPTEQSRTEVLSYFSRVVDPRSKRSNEGEAQTVPPTPLRSVPPTPSNPAKRQKMMIDGTNAREIEAEMILRENPVLYLEPAKDFEEVQTIIHDKLAHPLHQETPVSRKTRKRTTAELEQDEKLAAAEQRFMLLGDEQRTGVSGNGTTGAGTNGNENQGGATSFEPRFSRFKTLENIRERKAKEDEEREIVRKKQEAEQAAQRAARDAQQKKDDEQRRNEQRSIQHKNMLMQQQQRQAEAQAAHQAAQAAQAGQSQPQSAVIQNPPQHQQIHQVAGNQGSPIARQPTPMNSSPVVGGGNMMATPSMNGVPIARTASSQGAGSPPMRPQSAISQHPGNPMARQMSQQQHQSQVGTPHMPQATPVMGQANPINRPMSATPRMPQQSHPSPVPGQPAQTPMMVNGQFIQGHLTQEQQIHLMRQRQQLANMQANAAAAAAANGGRPDQMAQQAAMIQAQQRRQQELNGQISVGPNQLANYRTGMIANVQAQARVTTPSPGHHNQLNNPNMPPGMQQQQPPPQMQQVNQEFANAMRILNQLPPEVQNQIKQATTNAAKRQASIALSNKMQHLIGQYGGQQNVPPQLSQQLHQGMSNIANQFYQKIIVHNVREHYNMVKAAQAQAQAAQQQQQQQQAGQQQPGNVQQGQPTAVNPEYANRLRQMQMQMQQQGGRGVMMPGQGMNLMMQNGMVNGMQINPQMQQMMNGMNMGGQGMMGMGGGMGGMQGRMG